MRIALTTFVSFLTSSAFMVMVAMPVVALAAPPASFTEFVLLVVGILDPVLVLLMALATLVFFWGLGKFIFTLSSTDNREEGKQLMIWGLVGLFVMFSLYGILFFLTSELGFGPPGVPVLPTGR